MNAKNPTPRRSGGKVGPRSAARLGAVQALYQIELSGSQPETIIQEFLIHRLGQEYEGVRYAAADTEFFRDLVRGTDDNRAALDERVAATLAADWPLDRLEAVIRAILRAGAYELSFRPDVPTNAIINEYVNVAHAFYGGSEPGFVNGVLDRMAREIRG